jgi:UPF0755 protein
MDDTTASTTKERSEEARARLNPKSPREAITPEPAPAPPRSKRARNPFVVALNALITLLMIAAITVGAVLYWGKARFDEPGPLAEEKVILIPPASGLQSIADSLERQGVIADRYVFMGGVSAYRQSGRLKAGEYAFEPGISMRGVMDLLVSGKAILHSITIPEGLTSTQIVARLKADPILTGEIDEVPAEGSLLPETYKFSRGTTRAQILEQMKAAHERALAAVWKSRSPDLPVKTPDELVTLASIVEKETGRADERPRVAAVFVNRLEKGMRLQSDPTIIYGIVGGQGTLGRPIRRSDIDTKTPYNTYHVKGLPPGPIANPGRAALEAVATPSETNDLYFVADGTGGHVFAASLEDHNRNVSKWRQIERQRAAEGNIPADEKAPDAIDEAPEAAPAEDAAAAAAPAAGGELDVMDGAPRRDPGAPVLPAPKPAG